MNVTDHDYDQIAPAMIEDAVPALSCDMVPVPGSLMLMPIVALPEREREWMAELSVEDLAAMRADWRFLTTSRPTVRRPALIRLDLLFPLDGCIQITWEATTAGDLSALAYACLADRIAFRPEAHADTGIVVSDLGLRDLEEFREIAGRLRAMVLLEALYD